jgi:hypothetical protein
VVPSQEVTLVAATADDATVLSSLLELYLRELSEIFPIEVRADGQLGYDKLPLYWTEPSTHFAFLIRCRAQIAGFVLVTRGSPATDDPEDLDVAEFFVLLVPPHGHWSPGGISSLEPPFWAVDCAGVRSKPDRPSLLGKDYWRIHAGCLR